MRSFLVLNGNLLAKNPEIAQYSFIYLLLANDTFWTVFCLLPHIIRFVS